MDELIFLGTGGGRYTTLFQTRSTGGLIFKTCNHQIHIDPGPGALLRCKECKIYPFKTDVIMATHNHLDHINDLNIMVEAMTKAGTEKKGTLITHNSVVEERGISNYHKKLLNSLVVLEPEQNTSINGLRIQATRCNHSKLGCIGFKFYTPNYCLYYTGDTLVYSGFEKSLEDVDILVANVSIPSGINNSIHMNSDDLVSVIKNSNNKIKLIIITHFGTEMLRANPIQEAKMIMEKTGINTIAASDGLIVKLRDTIKCN